MLPVGRPEGALFPAQEFVIDELRAARRSMIATAMAILLSEKGQLDLKGEPAPVRATPRVGRNKPCPCGSGKKYKVCGGRTACTESRN